MTVTLPVLLPLILAFGVLAFGKKYPAACKICAGAGVAGAAAAVITLFFASYEMFYVGWCEGVLSLSFSCGAFERMTLSALVFFAAAVLVYGASDKIENERWFYFSFLFTLSFACGAVLADNLVLMLFFWEGLLVSLYIFILINAGARAAAFKAFIINAVGDVALIAGVALTAAAAGTSDISLIKTGPVGITEGYGAWAFLLLCVGALAKAGAVPFHSWIPEAAEKTNTSFTAYLPGAFEKILAAFLFARIVMLFDLSGTSLGGNILVWAAVPSLIIGAVLMFRQTDLKKFAAYNVIFQIGLLAFEQGAAPADAAALVNHGAYKAAALAGLFLCAGVLERGFGSSALEKLGGAIKKNKFTAVCFIIFSAVLCGVTPLDIFFSHSFAGLSGGAAGVIFMFITRLFVLLSFINILAGLFKGSSAAPEKVPAAAYVSVGILAFAALAYAFGWTFDETRIFSLPHAEFHLGWVTGASAGLMISSAALYIFASRGKAFDFIRTVRIPDFYGAARAAALAVSSALFKTDRFFDFVIDDIPSVIVRRFGKEGSAMHTGLSVSYILWAVIGAVVFAALSLSGGWM